MDRILLCIALVLFAADAVLHRSLTAGGLAILTLTMLV